MGEGYLVQRPNQNRKFYSSFNDIKETDLHDGKTAIITLNKSHYETLN